MNKKESPSVLVRSSDKDFSHLEGILKKRNVEFLQSPTKEEFIGKLRKDFISVAIIDTTSGDVSTHELITVIKSISPKTDVITITDPGENEGAKTGFDNPLDNLVYAYIETPVNPNYLATLTMKALEKQKLMKSVEKASQNRGKSNMEPGKSGAESQLLSASVNSLNSAVMVTDMNRDIIYINKAHVRTFGYLREELKGKKSDILYPLEDASGVSSKIYEALIMVGWEGERLALRKDGSAFPTYEKTSVIKDEGGRQIGIVSVIDDITKQKRLQQALKESEERYRTFVETAKSAIIAVNEEGKIILFNPAAKEIFGYEKEEILDREFSSLFPDRYQEIISSEIGNGRGSAAVYFVESASELAGLNKEGEEFPVDISLSTCKIEGQSILTAIIFDITERKNLEEQVLQSAKLAAVGELISGVTHEVNNPLAVVIGYAEMLLSEQDMNNEESREAIKSIHGEAERARKVIQNLLSFARKHSPEKEVIEINDILEKTLGLTEYELKKHSVKVIKELDPDLPDTVGDPNQLQQVFLNLIINSQHAMMETGDDRQLTVRTKVKEKQSPGKPGMIPVIEISFEDNGPGIPEKIMKKIFDPFYTTKDKGKGTGLGLSVSFGIIKEHGGEIYARPNEEKGVTFFIDLPV
ncbi:MAG: PAS domain S-box protein [Deltaproteobacteria bacterium]